jgi:hypothetical protein
MTVFGKKKAPDANGDDAPLEGDVIKAQEVVATVEVEEEKKDN